MKSICFNSDMRITTFGQRPQKWSYQRLSVGRHAHSSFPPDKTVWCLLWGLKAPQSGHMGTVSGSGAWTHGEPLVVCSARPAGHLMCSGNHHPNETTSSSFVLQEELRDKKLFCYGQSCWHLHVLYRLLKKHFHSIFSLDSKTYILKCVQIRCTLRQFLRYNKLKLTQFKL